MNRAPRAVRPHIGILGRVNVGKSTLMNALTGQAAALVSEEPGTTTDPVFRSMEMLPFGPVVIVDTGGLEDPTELGRARSAATGRVLRRLDLGLVVVEEEELHPVEEEIIGRLEEMEVPWILVHNYRGDNPNPEDDRVAVDALRGEGVEYLKEKVAHYLDVSFIEPPLVGDLLSGDAPVLLVAPIDGAAPKGRLILPQVQTMRDILDAGYAATICRETELEETLGSMGQLPQLVITDSQVFGLVAGIIPESVPLTSFSILMARYKGDLGELVSGIEAVRNLEEGDKVLIVEGCTHHRQDDDIGTVKIPRILRQMVGGELEFTWRAGQADPGELHGFDLIIHCGGCMLGRRDMVSRVGIAREAGVPMVNYGVFLAHASGILDRSLEPLLSAI